RRFIHWVCGAPTMTQAIDAFYAQFNVRPLMKELRAKNILVAVGDGWHSASFADAKFLGRTLPFTTGPFALGRAAAVPLVPVFCAGAPHRMRFEFEPAFVVERTECQQEDVARAVQFYAERVEERMLAD